jgi:hypothetical protein
VDEDGHSHAELSFDKVTITGKRIPPVATPAAHEQFDQLVLDPATGLASFAYTSRVAQASAREIAEMMAVPLPQVQPPTNPEALMAAVAMSDGMAVLDASLPADIASGYRGPAGEMVSHPVSTAIGLAQGFYNNTAGALAAGAVYGGALSNNSELMMSNAILGIDTSDAIEQNNAAAQTAMQYAQIAPRNTAQAIGQNMVNTGFGLTALWNAPSAIRNLYHGARTTSLEMQAWPKWKPQAPVQGGRDAKRVAFGFDTIPQGQRLILRPIEIEFPASGLTPAKQKLFTQHLLEQEEQLNNLSLLRTDDLKLNLANFGNVKKQIEVARRTGRGYLYGSGEGMDASHRLDSIAGGYIHDFVGYRDPVQRYIGSLWRTRAEQIVPGREHQLKPIFDGN